MSGKKSALRSGSIPRCRWLKPARSATRRATNWWKANTPAQTKRDAKLVRALLDATTFEKVARQWWEHWKGPRSPRHAEYVLRRLEVDVFPVLGSRPIAEVTAPQLLAMAKRIESRGALDIAKRSLQTCGQIMRFAVAHGMIERNPSADVKPSMPSSPGARKTTPDWMRKRFPNCCARLKPTRAARTRVWP